MDEFVSKIRDQEVKYSREEGLPKKQKRNYSELLPPSLTQDPSTNLYGCLFSSYDIFFMVNDDEDDNGIARRISKGYKINIHADGDGPDKFYSKSKPLIPFYRGKMQGFGDFAILGSHICGFYNRVSRVPTRDVSKLRVIPHVDKECIPSPMICRRSFTHASVIGGKIYVRNRQPYKHTDPQWGEVYDPVNEKWKAFPNPPNYPPNYRCWVTGQPHSSPTDIGRIRSPKTLQAQHLRGRKNGNSNSRPPGLRLSNSRLPVRDLLRRQRARIRGLRDLRVLGPRIRGPMPET
jgi:hypothetical protein